MLSQEDQYQYQVFESIKSLEGDEKNMWKVVKQLGDQNEDYVIQPLKNDAGEILSADSEIAEEFSEHYGGAEVMVERERREEIQAKAADILRTSTNFCGPAIRCNKFAAWD